MNWRTMVVNFCKLNDLEVLLSNLENKRILNIEIQIYYNEIYTFNTVKDLLNKYTRIQKIVFFSVKNENNGLEELKPYIVLRTDQLDSIESCGNISLAYFTIDISTFTENQLHNSCLNRKICIDQNGNIKNCPSMKKTYGIINDRSIKEIIENTDFKDIWFVNKDKVEVCSDCEFRYVCSDCRVFVDDQTNIYSRPAKCNYNPYIAKWKGEVGYLTIKEWQDKNIII